jgi:hypothetical protein
MTGPLQIESFPVINLRGVSTNKRYIHLFYRHAIIQRTYVETCLYQSKVIVLNKRTVLDNFMNV